MPTVTLPRSSLHVAPICLGSTGIGSAIPAADSFRLLDAYMDHSGNFVDTASVYANWLPIEQHVSEKTIGRWMAERGCRQRIVLATKGGHPELSSMHVSRLSPAEIEADLHSSLRNLQTDHIDLYWLHRDDPALPVEPILQTLDDARRAGKIGVYGCSNWSTARMRAAQRAAEAHVWHGFVASQVRWSLAVVDQARIGDRTTVTMDDAMHAYHVESGLAAIPYSSQANGLFQKAERAGWSGLPANCAIYPQTENEPRLRRVVELGRELGLTITQVVLGYLLSQPFVTVPIVGCRTLGQLEDTLSAANVQLTPQQVAYLETL